MTVERARQFGASLPEVPVAFEPLRQARRIRGLRVQQARRATGSATTGSAGSPPPAACPGTVRRDHRPANPRVTTVGAATPTNFAAAGLSGQRDSGAAHQRRLGPVAARRRALEVQLASRFSASRVAEFGSAA